MQVVYFYNIFAIWHNALNMPYKHEQRSRNARFATQSVRTRRVMQTQHTHVAYAARACSTRRTPEIICGTTKMQASRQNNNDAAAKG